MCGAGGKSWSLACRSLDGAAGGPHLAVPRRWVPFQLCHDVLGHHVVQGGALGGQSPRLWAVVALGHPCASPRLLQLPASALHALMEPLPKLLRRIWSPLSLDGRSCNTVNVSLAQQTLGCGGDVSCVEYGCMAGSLRSEVGPPVPSGFRTDNSGSLAQRHISSSYGRLGQPDLRLSSQGRRVAAQGGGHPCAVGAASATSDRPLKVS